MTRLLGIDLGERRVGVAVSDPAGLAARPLLTFRRGTLDEDAAVLRRLAAEQRAVTLVIGLPLALRGEEGPQADRTRAWGFAMGERTGLAVRWRDERLTTVAAQAALGPVPRRPGSSAPTRVAVLRRRGRLDREAAARILQAELDAPPAAAVPAAAVPPAARDDTPEHDGA